MQETGADLASAESLAHVSTRSRPRDPLTSVTLTRGHFEVVCEQRRVDGGLNDETWSRVVGALELAQFPRHSDKSANDTVEISCTRDGVANTIVVAVDSSKYRDIARLTTSIAEQAVPELRASPVNQSDISRITSAHGRVAASRFGRVELEIAANDTFQARHETGRVRRSWIGRLANGTFQRAVREMTAAGFPKVKPLGPLPPGAAPRELSWDRPTGTESAHLADDDRGFDQLDMIFSSILTVLDQTLARMPPGATTPVIEWHDERSVS